MDTMNAKMKLPRLRPTAALVTLTVLVLILGPIAGQSDCKCKEKLHNGMGYLLCSCEKTWDNANTYCKDSYQGQLAIITDSGLQQIVEEHLDSNRASDTWIGAKGVVGDWRWMHDQQTIAYQGCFQDDPVDRDLNFDLRLTTVTPQNCIKECGLNGYKYAGLQAGSLCYCGNTFGKHGFNTDGCSNPCSGDFNQNCGGGLANDIYTVDGSWSGGWVFGFPSGGAVDDQECMVYKCETFFGWSWQNDRCERQFRYLCMFDMDNSTCIAQGYTPTAETCISYPDTEPVSWFEAGVACTKLGGRLLEFRSALSHWAIRAALENKCNLDALWVGATKVSWSWANGAPLKYTNWATSRPANEGDKCVAMSFKLSRSYEWSDLSCDETLSFVCERPVGPRKTTTTTTSTTTTTTPMPTTTTSTKGHSPSGGAGTVMPPISTSPEEPKNGTSTTPTEDKGDWIPIYIGIAVAIVVFLLLVACIIYCCLKRCRPGGEKTATMRVENGYSNRAGFVHDGDFAYKTPGGTKNGGFTSDQQRLPYVAAVTPNNASRGPPPVSIVPPTTNTKDADFSDNVTTTVTSASSADATSGRSSVSSSSSVYIGELDDQGVSVKYVHPRDAETPTKEEADIKAEHSTDDHNDAGNQATLPLERNLTSATKGPAPAPPKSPPPPPEYAEKELFQSEIDISTRL